MMLVVLGAHGVGKTTLCRRLSMRLGLPFDEEIGRMLAEDRAFRAEGATAADPQEAFDRAVFSREVQRDIVRLGSPRIVETWHPGNLAYAELRSPAEVQRWMSTIETLCRLEQPLVLPLVASEATLARRQSEPGDPAFFSAVGLAAAGWARRLGLHCLEPVETDVLSPDALLELVVRRLRTHCNDSTRSCCQGA